MIPLLLKLVEQPVQPEGFDKIAYVLNLSCPYSIAEIQKYAQVPPGQALLPPPDSEAPDDLFPQLKKAPSEPLKETTNPNEELSDLWTKAKSKVYHHDIQDNQIANWFEKNFHISVRLKDFEAISPPAGLTVVALSRFCHSVDLYTR